MSVVIRDSVHQTEVHRVGTCSDYRRLLQLLGRIIMQKAYGRICAEADAPQFDCKSLHKGGISHYKSLHQQVIASACFPLFPLLSSYTSITFSSSHLPPPFLRWLGRRDKGFKGHASKARDPNSRDNSIRCLV